MLRAGTGFYCFQTVKDGEFKREMARAWAEVNLDALRHNAATAQRSVSPSGKLMAVVKADGYGHGLGRIVSALRSDIHWFGVANAWEGQEVLRHAPEASVFILGALLPKERELAAERGMVVGISTPEEAHALSQCGTPVRVHLLVDTGMGRLGCLEENLQSLRELVEGLPGLRLEGVASHLPSADEDEPYTREQLKAVRRLLESHRDLAEIHVANSAGMLGFSEEREFATLHRPGLMLYGVSPLAEFQSELEPVMTLKSRVTLLRCLPAGRGISYGRTFVTDQETWVATVGIGYGDGYPRHLSNQGTEVLVAGERCPLLGRVTMDQIMVDVSSVRARIDTGEEVVLFGCQGEACLPVAEIASRAGTIPWEVLTGITRRVPRYSLEVRGRGE